MKTEAYNLTSRSCAMPGGILSTDCVRCALFALSYLRSFSAFSASREGAAGQAPTECIALAKDTGELILEEI